MEPPVETPPTTGRRPAPLPRLRAAHIEPSLAVACVAALLSVSTDLALLQAIVLASAVLAGQLTVGWGNGLLAVAGPAVLALVVRGKVPFHAATAIALVNVTLLVVVVP
jgi:hypothetical protein